MATTSPGKGIGAQNNGGTIVKPLPPPPTTTIATTISISTAPTSNASPSTAAATQTTSSGAVNIINATIAKRKAKMDIRKRELLVEARNARIEWILNSDAKTGGGSTHKEGGSNNTNINRLNELQACSSDILPCAPQIIESMLSSNCDWRRHEIGMSSSSASQNGILKQVLEEQHLSWESVSKLSSLNVEEEKEEEVAATTKNQSLDLPPVMPNSHYYTAFLNILCEPSAANVVMSIQKFCKTIQEAANVMVLSMQESSDKQESDMNGAATSPSQQAQINHGASLAKAIRGFINTTLREMEEHEAFHDYLYPEQENDPTDGTSVTANKDGKPTIDDDAREQLLASLEKFVYMKCRHDIDMVLLAGKEVRNDSRENASGKSSTKTMKELEVELHDTMKSLGFVTPAHLEISCLDPSAENEDIDLSYTIQQLQSINDLSSPRQILQSILLAHRGVSVALHEACVHKIPPGADDVLPTLILATLRAHPPNLSTTLRFIEHFAPLPLLRGEAGYAYTNLCGAMQFIQELDVQGHLEEVTLGGMGEGASLLIGPEEFRLGLEECRRKMKKAEEEGQMSKGQEEDGSHERGKEFAGADMNGKDCTNGETPFKIKITARAVREARSHGESVDLDWAIQRQNDSMWQEGRIKDTATRQPEKEATTIAVGRGQQRHIPPEKPPLPSQFSRSYSFLTTRPENIGICDLPQLLKEYKMLVHATEKLLDERTVWRESERKRQLKLEREHLERDLAGVIGADESNRRKLANGH